MSKRLVPLNWRLMQDDGATPVSDGVLNFYLAGSTTPATVYENKELSNPIGTSVDLDSIGYPEDNNVWGPDAVSYKVGVQGTGFNSGAEKFFDYLEVAGNAAEVYAATGGGTAFAVTTGLFQSVIPTNSRISIVAPASNTVDAITLNVDAIGAVVIKKRAGFFLSVGDMIGGGVYDLYYDGTNWILQNPDSPVEGFLTGPISGVRLTLDNGNASPAADQLAKTVIYAVSVQSIRVAVGNGVGYKYIYMAGASVRLDLDADSGHTLYHQSGKNFDVWAFEGSAGEARIGTGAAWTDDVTRAEALQLLKGIRVNAGAITVRYGDGSSETQAVAAGCATYLGTVRMSANGQTEDSFANRFVWNMYNRVLRPVRRFETTDSWAGSAAASWRQANNSTANQIGVVRGLDEDTVHLTVSARASNSGATARSVRTGIGLDAVNAIATGCRPASKAVDNTALATSDPMIAFYDGFPGVGYHYLAWLEYDNTSDTRTWFGDNGSPTTEQYGISGFVVA